MGHRSWGMFRASVAIAAPVCLALSTQILFQRSLYREWPVSEIAYAWARGLADLAIVAACIVAALNLAYLIPARRMVSKALLFAAGMVGGAILGEWIVLSVQWGALAELNETIFMRALRWTPIGIVCGAIALARQRTGELSARLHQSEVDRMELERQMVAIQVQTLQSQVEPHFLFNTLATVRRLHQVDPAKGRKTFSGFLQYLRSALPEMRARHTTLGHEVDLIAAYLEVLRVRMGSRLAFEIDVPAGLRDHLVPPLSLATLVENAIKHGLSELPEGGRVTVRARVESGALSILIADTGGGFTKAGGTGTGLANLRLRLRGLYGDAAALTLSQNTPRGLAAMLRIPAIQANTDIAHVGN